MALIEIDFEDLLRTVSAIERCQAEDGHTLDDMRRQITALERKEEDRSAMDDVISDILDRERSHIHKINVLDVRIESMARRLADVEADFYEPANRPPSDPAADNRDYQVELIQQALAEWDGRSDARLARILGEKFGRGKREPETIDPDAPRRFRWPKTDNGSAWGYGVYFPVSRTTCTDTSTWLDACPWKIFKGLEWLDSDPEPAAGQPDGSKDKADIVTKPGDHWHLRTPPMAAQQTVGGIMLPSEGDHAATIGEVS